MTKRPATRSRPLGWIALLVATIVLLRLAASGALAPPPLHSIDALRSWTDAREPTATAIALVRFAGELAAWYLLGLTALYGLASVSRSGGLTSLADSLAAPGAARLVRSGLGVGLVVSTAAGAATYAETAAATGSTATMQPVPSTDGPGSAWMVPQADHAPSPAALPTTTAERPSTWTVTEGESFWSIAGDVLADELGRPPTDAEIDPYWRALIEVNRDRLVDNDDPDLIHPGQVFEVPSS